MQKRLKRQGKRVDKKLTKPNGLKEFHELVDQKSNLEVRQRHDDKKRSKKLGVRVSAGGG